MNNYFAVWCMDLVKLPYIIIIASDVLPECNNSTDY